MDATPSATATTTCADRRTAWFGAGETSADVLVIGGGVMGACVFHHLARAGLKVVLAERDDFAGGASQGSAGLVWGGLLYLGFGRWREVAHWCLERERLAREWPDWVTPHTCLYRPQPARRNPWAVKAGLLAYGCLGGKRRPPRDGLLAFEEARLTDADARFTWHWIASAPANGTAFNRCEAHAFDWNGSHWHTTLTDRLHGAVTRLRTRWVVNAGGPWAKRLDQAAGVNHRWDLAFSRGTSLVVPAGGVKETLICEHPHEDDVLTRVPFGGRHAIWGSTETLVDSPMESLEPAAAEVAALLDLHRRCLGPLEAAQVTAVRCGVRAMAVPAGWQAGGSRAQSLERGLRVLADPKRPWLSLYGGKLSACAAAGREVAGRITGGKTNRLPARPLPAVPMTTFPGMPEPVPDPAWCRDHEQCWSLTDYLRRRTRIGQCVPRAGCGARGEHAAALRTLAEVLADGDKVRARTDGDDYFCREVARHDRLLGLLPGVNR